MSSNLVITRKLSLSDNQRRKQLIAGAAKNLNQKQKGNYNKFNSPSQQNNKRFGCLRGNDDNHVKFLSKRNKSDNFLKPSSSTQISSIELMDTGICIFILEVAALIVI